MSNLPPHLRFPDGTADDFLAYFIWLCDDGLFQLMNPLGEGLDLAESYVNVKQFWWGAQQYRQNVNWYRNLTGWLRAGVCSEQELGVVVMQSRLTRLGIIARSPQAWQNEAIGSLGLAPSPSPTQILLLQQIRKCACDQKSSTGEILDGLRILEICGGFERA